MRLKMIPGDRRIAVGKAGGVINVRRSIRAPRQCVLAAEMKRIALVMVEQEKARGRRGTRTDQAANDAAEPKSELIGIGEIDLRPVADPRGTQRQFPAIDSRALHIDREKHIRVVQAVVVEEVFRASQKVVGIERPALEGNGDAKLVLFVALPAQGYEIKLLLSPDIVQRGPR